MENILDRVRKILALAKNNPNQNESETAMRRAQQLMLEHNLTQSDLKEPEEYVVDRGNFPTGKILTESRHIFPILRDFFFVEMFVTRSRSGYQNFNRKQETTWSFIGKPENIEVAKYVFEYLSRTYRSLYREYLDENYGKSFRSQQYAGAFYSGVASGLSEKLSRDRNTFQEERGLVVVKDPNLMDILNNQENMRKGGKHFYSGNEAAKSSGYEKGKEIQIRHGISEHNATPLLG